MGKKEKHKDAREVGTKEREVGHIEGMKLRRKVRK